VKHVPVAERPKYISDLLGAFGAAWATDYTAYESQFIRRIMMKCEMKLYLYMIQFLSTRSDFVRHLEAILGKQVCIFKLAKFVLDTCRLSGEMCTSLGNGFSNLMFALFTAHKKGCTNVRIVVEGDDGLMKFDGPDLSAEDFALLGLTIKMEKHENIETASFCGIIFDSEELINIDDPREALAGLGWGGSKYTLSKPSKKIRLLRCKALSLAHQYPGCPIIQELADYALRATRSHNVGKVGLQSCRNMWERDQLQAALNAHDEGKILRKNPGPRSRALVESMYGVSVEAQLAIESYLREKNDLSPLSCDWINQIMPDVWRDYSCQYVRYTDRDSLNKQCFVQSTKNYLRELLELPGVGLSRNVYVQWVQEE